MSAQHDLDALAAFVEDRLDEGGRARLMEHLAECRECRATLAAMTPARAEGALARPARAEPSSNRRRLQAGLALAASLLLVTFGWMRFASPPTADDGGELTVRRSAERIVNGKTFRLEQGAWIDRASDDAR